MSKKNRTTKQNFEYYASGHAPKTPKIQTEWNLRKLYYTGEHDPQIEKDVRKAERAYANFAKKYEGKDFLSTPEKLQRALKELERIANMPECSKPARYFSFRHVLNAKDTAAEKQGLLIGNRMKKAGNSIIFFSLELGRLPKKTQQAYFKSPVLEPYRYYLERVFLEAKHDLSVPEEKILNLKSGTSYSMWVAATEKVISNRTITYKKRDLPVNEALEILETLPSKEKPKLYNTIMVEMEKIGEIAENEFTAILNDAKIDDELRGYNKPYSATVLGYEDDEKSIESLIAAVSSEGFELSKKFYKLKAKYHGVKALDYAQKYDSIGVAPVIPFKQAVDICRDVFYGVKNEYGQIFDRMLENGQIDVYPKSGKRGGAFMSNATNLPTHVFLNQVDTFKSLETLAHEMGHAIHSERSKSLSVFYQDHSITTAETASTLFEHLVFNAVYEQAKEKDKLVLLHDKITRNIATIQRQIAFFNAELEMHTTVREQGAVTNQDLRGIMERHLKSYLGTGVRVEKDDGYSYVYIPHFRYGFYVYTYCFGHMMSTLMANRYQADSTYIDAIDTFLTSGKKDTVANIFKEIGINTKRPETFSDGLVTLKNEISEFQKLTTRTHK